MLQAIFEAITGIFSAITGIFSFIGAFIDNLVSAVQQFIYYSDYVKGLLSILPALHIITGTLGIAISIGVVLKILGR